MKIYSSDCSFSKGKLYVMCDIRQTCICTVRQSEKCAMQKKKNSYKFISSCYDSPLPSQPCPDYVTWMKFINHNYSLLPDLSGEVQQAEEKWMCCQPSRIGGTSVKA